MAKITRIKTKSADPDIKKDSPSPPLWDLINEMQDTGRYPSVAGIISIAKKKGIPIGWSDLFDLDAREAIVIPPFITSFLSAYIAKRDVQSVLDPWAGVGSLLLPIVEAKAIPEAKGISPIEDIFTIARALDVRSLVTWVRGSPKEELNKLGTFDFIVSSPPWGLRPLSEKIETDSGTIEVRDSETHVVALNAARHLSKDGEAVFILPNSFFLGDRTGTVRQNLPKFGLFINSIIAVPAGAFASATSLEVNLVFISRKETTDVFVGRLNPDGDPTPLLKNLERRKVGAAPELGRLVKLPDYRSWHALVTEEEVRRLAERSGLSPLALADIVESVNLGRQSDDGGFNDLPNAVYLPLIGTSPAVTAVSDFRIKPHNYVQLIVRPDKAYAEFLAGFFNSPFGRKIRDSMLHGTFIPKITKQSLLAASVYLAPLETQRQAMESQRELTELTLHLQQLERELWNRPVEATKIRRAVSSINQKSSFESWLEMLPFPLASILWRYHATTNVEHKNTHLFDFFEATAQFLGTLMASAFHSNPQYFQMHKREWFDAGKDNPHSLVKSSFGEWVVRCERLAKTTRQMLSSNEDERNLCLDLYKTRDIAKIEALSSKSLFPVLKKVGDHRNLWKGHTGIVSAKEHARRLTTLQEELTRFWSVLGSVFEDWWLIRPGANEYTEGIYHFRADMLMGSRQIFKQIEVETTVVMDSRETYFFDPTTRLPLQVLHFFRMMPSPETDEIACYFYNRLDKEGVRWVSYHFEGKAERVEPDAAIIKIIQEAEGNNE